MTIVNSDGAAGATINASSAANADVVKTIIASSRGKKYPIYLLGNTLANSLLGSAGDDTINAATGNNSLTGGKGNDIFICGGGYDVITDYTNSSGNSDTIQISYSDFDTYKVDGNDVILVNSTSNKDLIKVINGKGKYLNIINTSGSDTSKSMIYNDPNSLLITGTSGNDSLTALKDRTTLTGGKGKDTLVYSSGEVHISDYTAGQDVIQIDRKDYTGYHVWGSDLYFSFSDTNSANVLWVYNGAGKKISTVINGQASVGTYKDNESYVLTSKATTVDGNDSGMTKFVTFDASSLKVSTIITGNKSLNNVLKGGAGADTLDGGDSGTTKTDDLLIGGKGKDTFVYRGGDDVISDYVAGQDVVKLIGSTMSNYEVSGKDIVATLSNGTLTIKNGLDKQIDFITSTNAADTTNSKVYNDSTKKIFAKSDSDEVYSDTTGVVTFIDASKKSSPIGIISSVSSTIKGTAKADSIVGGASIIAGAGNDTIETRSVDSTITGGKGKDVFVIGRNGAGLSTTITDYTAGQDIIQLESNITLSQVVFANDGDSETDIEFKFSNNSSLVVQNGIKISGTKVTPQKITIIDGAGNKLNRTYLQNSLSIGNNDGDTINLSLAYNSSIVSADASSRGAQYPISLIGNAKANTLKGGKGNDTITANGNSNQIYGMAGADIITVNSSSANNTIIGGAGNDTIYSNNLQNVIKYTTGEGADVIVNFSANNEIFLGSAKTKVTKAENVDNDYVLTIGTGSLTIKNLDSSTAVTVTSYDGGKTVYNETTTERSYNERVEEAWFTSIESSEFDIALDDIINTSPNAVLFNSTESLTRIDEEMIGSTELTNGSKELWSEEKNKQGRLK